MFQGLGNTTNLLINCLDSYPQNYTDYLADKRIAKIKLQPHMRAILTELNKQNIFKAFLNKALFDGGNEDYLIIFIDAAKLPKYAKIFHVFHKDDVVDAFFDSIELKNSKARNANQMDDQKIIFKSTMYNKNIGKIEDRHDSRVHYKEMKFRLTTKLVFDILTQKIALNEKLNTQVITYESV